MAGWYNRGKEGVLNGSVDLLVDTLSVLLVGPGYNFDPDHGFVSDIVADEVTGTNYARKTLSAKTVSRNEGSDRAEFDAADTAWPSIIVGTIKGAVVFKNTGVDATSVLLWYADGGFPVSASGVNLTIQWPASGLTHLKGE